jgi:hypothetical protein
VKILLLTLKNERGDVAMMLFPIFILILIISGMAAAEFASYIVTRQRISYIAREAASLAITRCWDVIKEEQKAGGLINIKTMACLESDRVKKDLLDHVVGKSLKDFDTLGVIKIHIWIGDYTKGPATTGKLFASITVIDLHNTQHKIVTPKLEVPIGIDGIYLKLMAERNHRLAVSEIFYAYKPITSLNKIIKFSIPNRIYENAIF